MWLAHREWSIEMMWIIRISHALDDPHQSEPFGQVVQCSVWWRMREVTGESVEHVTRDKNSIPFRMLSHAVAADHVEVILDMAPQRRRQQHDA